MGRAVAHGRTAVASFSDPTAYALLPPERQRWVDDFRAGARPTQVRERIRNAYLSRQSQVMVVRTVTIDDAVREKGAPQLVILGAGLDGRAYRMGELAETVVFEIDHPDSQRDKRSRVGALAARAKEVRFVSVDFTRDSLAEAIERAGHDPARPTTWLWEGVIMYLTLEEIEATLRVVAGRSAPGSRLIGVYHAPAIVLRLMGFLVARLGEPFKSRFPPSEMRALLARHGLDVMRDGSVAELATPLGASVHGAAPATHLRIFVADKR